jgi:hypothetical protein
MRSSWVAEMRDRDPAEQAAFSGLDRELGDAPVRSRGPHPFVAGAGGRSPNVCGRNTSIGDEHHATRNLSGIEPRREREGARDIGLAVGGFDQAERLVEGPDVG